VGRLEMQKAMPLDRRPTPPWWCSLRQILFLPLGIFDSYVSLIQNKLFFGTLRRISDLTNLAVTSWAFSWFLSPGLYVNPKRTEQKI
jgi:hypothetical protein